MLCVTDLGSSDWLEQLQRLTRALGGKEFEEQVVALLNLLLPIDHCVVFTHGADGVGHLFTHGKMAAQTAEQLANDYVQQYHDRDPMFATLASDEAGDLGKIRPLDLQTEYDPAYRNHFFDRNGLIDKASTVGRVKDGSVLCNFYRMAGSPRYSLEDRARLERILPLVTALIAAHFRLVKKPNPNAPDSATSRERTRSLVHTIIGKQVAPFDRLTAREREVCERILLGYTSIGIGLDLDIAPSSVLTYRKRAYEKLGIGSQNELFALCLDASRV
jgi:DNA-binding CsgD family transcriptional regulator